MMYKNPQTVVILTKLIDHLLENESPALFDEAVEDLYRELKRRTVNDYGNDIAELFQLELNNKIYCPSKYRLAYV